MGAASSHTDDLVFDFRDECERWALEHVQSAYARWGDIKAKTGDAGITMNRRTFFEVFTDYTVLSGGAFLSLPLSSWTTFDTKGTNKLYALEVFILLALFCRSDSLEPKVDFLFDLFDFSHTFKLSSADMVILMQSVTTAAFKVQITASKPATAQLEKLAEEAFIAADTDMDSSISRSEFREWAMGNVKSMEIFKMFGAAGDEAFNATSPSLMGSGSFRKKKSKTGFHLARSGKGHTSSPTTGSPSRGRPASRGAAAGAGAGSARDARSRSASGAPRRRRSKAEHNDDDSSGLNLAGLEAKNEMSRGPRAKIDNAPPRRADREAAHLKLVQRRTRQMKLKTVATGKVMHELMDETDFDLRDLNALANRFVDVSDVTGKLSQEQFKTIVTESVPHLGESEVLGRLYEVVDASHDGQVDFHEFVLLLSKIVSGNLEDKIEVLFKMHDLDGSGSMPISELVNLLRSSTDMLSDSVAFAEELLASFDVNGDGEISTPEFVAALSGDKLLMNTFNECVSVKRSQAREIHILKDSHDGMDNSNLEKVMKNIAAVRARYPEQLTRADFVRFLENEFHVPMSDKAEEHAASVFKAFDSADCNSVPFVDLLSGLVQVLSFTIEETVSYYFALYDFDESHTLDKDEIMTMLVGSLQRKDANAQRVMQMLAALDTDGDHTITLPEFKEQARSNPVVMEAVELIFGSYGARKPSTTRSKSFRRAKAGARR